MEELIVWMQVGLLLGLAVLVIATALFACHYVLNIFRACCGVLNRRKRNIKVDKERRRERWYDNK